MHQCTRSTLIWDDETRRKHNLHLIDHWPLVSRVMAQSTVEHCIRNKVIGTIRQYERGGVLYFENGALKTVVEMAETLMDPDDSDDEQFVFYRVCQSGNGTLFMKNNWIEFYTKAEAVEYGKSLCEIDMQMNEFNCATSHSSECNCVYEDSDEFDWFGVQEVTRHYCYDDSAGIDNVCDTHRDVGIVHPTAQGPEFICLEFNRK